MSCHLNQLTWCHQTVCMVSHHFDVPHSSLPQDPIFHFVAFLHELNPLTWAWHSSDCTPMTVPPTTLSEKLQDQLTDINQALHLIEHTLAQDWQLWGALTRYDGRRDICRPRRDIFKEKGEAKMPLRMHMFLQCFQLLAQRAQQLKLDASDDALVQILRSKGILTEDSKWAYLSWDSQAMMLKPNRMPPLTSEEIRSLLERIAHLGQQPGVIHKFSALRPVKQDTLPQDATTATPWRLDLSLRSPEASELF